MIQPVMVIGLGGTATHTLDEVARGLQQAYGSAVKDSVALIGFAADTDTAPPQHPWVRMYHHFFNESLAGWVKTAPPALKNWFDTAYYLRPNRIAHLSQRVDERQILRAHFVSHMVNDTNGGLVAFLEARREWFSQLISPGDSIYVYFLADSDDPATALLLDIINLVNYVFKGQATYSLLHLALSSSWQSGKKGQTQSVSMARSFAILREISRFTTTYGETQHTVYAEGSGLERYNTPSSAMITQVMVYPSLPQQQLVQVWADTLLPQMERPIQRERSTIGFGHHYEQFHLANNFNKRQHRIDQTSQRYSLYVDSYEVRTALFPWAQLQQHWAARLSYDALAGWIGETPTDIAYALQESFVKQVWHDEKGDVYCPESVVRLLALAPEDLQSIDAVETVLYRAETQKHGNNPDMSPLGALQTHLAWQPNIDTIQAHGLSTFAERTQKDLREHRDGYGQALRYISRSTLDRFDRVMDAYITYHLNKGGGVRVVHAVIGHMRDKIAQALELLRDQRKRESNTSNVKKQLDDLRWVAGDIEQFRTGIRRNLSPSLIAYFNRVREVWAALRREVALEVMFVLLNGLHDTVESHYDALNRWASPLWKGEQALLTTASARAQQPIRLEQSPYRLWLYDEAWQRETYEKRITPLILPQLRENLQWHPSRTDDNAWIPYIADYSADTSEMYTLWLEKALTLVEQNRLDLWNDYLLPNNTYHRRLPDIRALFSQARAVWPKEASVSEYVILPKTMVGKSQAMDAEIWAMLHDQNRVNDGPRESEDTTRLVHYVLHEAFGLFELPAYNEAQQAYQALDKEQRARLHVLAAECEAVYWESLSKRFLRGQPILFENSVVALLTHLDALKQFIWLNALGLVSVQSYDADKHFELALPGSKFFWLDDTQLSLLQAVTNFVFKAKHASFKEKPTVGQPRGILQSPLPSASALDELIVAVIRNRVYVGETDYQGDLHRRYQSLHGVPQAVLQIERAQVLLNYYTALEERINVRAPRFDKEQQLLILLRLIAEELYNDYRQRIDNWV